LALTKSMAEAFLQAATHAPQPMQAAAFMPPVPSRRGNENGVGVGRVAVFTEIVAPRFIIRSKADGSTTRSPDTERPGPPRLDDNRVAVRDTAACCKLGRVSFRRRGRGPGR